jgi:hypothetical protein
LRPFPRRAALAVLAIAGGYAIARSFELRMPVETKSSLPASTTVVTGGELAGVDPSGDVVLTRALAALERWPNVAGRFRQSMRVGDELQSGRGDYWQQGVGNQRRTYWQWQTRVDGQQAAFVQVYDRNGHLWTDVRFRPGQRTVTRVNVASLRRDLALAVDAANEGRGGPTAAELEVLARGGLSQLVAELRRAFAFGPPTAVVEQDRPMIALVGTWREDALHRQWQSLSTESPSDWPGHLPHHVVVKLGREDYFPYVVEYRRGADAGLASSVVGVSDPLARIEFFDVRWGVVNVDERLFEFTPADVEWRDETAAALERLRPTPPPTAPMPVAQREGTWRQ